MRWNAMAVAGAGLAGGLVLGLLVGPVREVERVRVVEVEREVEVPVEVVREELVEVPAAVFTPEQLIDGACRRFRAVHSAIVAAAEAEAEFGGDAFDDLPAPDPADFISDQEGEELRRAAALAMSADLDEIDDGFVRSSARRDAVALGELAAAVSGPWSSVIFTGPAERAEALEAAASACDDR